MFTYYIIYLFNNYCIVFDVLVLTKEVFFKIQIWLLELCLYRCSFSCTVKRLVCKCVLQYNYYVHVYDCAAPVPNFVFPYWIAVTVRYENESYRVEEEVGVVTLALVLEGEAVYPVTVSVTTLNLTNSSVGDAATGELGTLAGKPCLLEVGLIAD